jgi:hydrogenase nickel incorporation protein HypA/HybF
MHELSIALSLVDLAAEEAERHGGGRVVALHVRLGPLSGVVKEALLSAYELAREGAVVEGAELILEEVPIVAYCGPCAAQRTLESMQMLCCPVCGSPTPTVIQGRELQLVALEIEP